MCQVFFDANLNITQLLMSAIFFVIALRLIAALLEKNEVHFQENLSCIVLKIDGEISMNKPKNDARIN